MNVGVDIGHEFLRMVKAKKADDDTMAIIDCKNVPFTHIASKKSPEFRSFLKSELLKFCGTDKNVDIWAIMSAARVNVRHVRIPKVAKKQIENAIYWTIKKETPFDEKDTVFDFEIQGEVIEQGVNRFVAIVYTAPKNEVEELKNLFSEVGMPLTGLSITPFAIQNMFAGGTFPAAGGTVASLFIGNDFSRIDIYAQGKLTMTRGIKAGINSLIESLIEKMRGASQDTPTLELAGKLTGMEEARKILFSLSPDSPRLEAGDAGYELTEQEKFEAILPALDRVITQVERTFEHYSAGLNYARVEKIYVSTAMSLYPPIVTHIGEQLRLESDILDPLNLKISCLEEEVPPACVSERIALTPAIGIALSDIKYTPNLLFRYKDKEQVANIARVTRLAFSALVGVTLICAGVFFYQMYVINQKRATIMQLEGELSRYNPRVDQSMISQMIAGALQIQQMSKAYSEKYVGIAIIGELSDLTPSNIRLLSLKASMGGVPTGTDSSKKEPAKGEMKNLVIEGVIFGDRKELEASLVNYVMKLESSPMFRQISVQKNSIESFKKEEVLHFIIDAKTG